MREILFRGKMKKDGIWRYGNLCTACGGKYIVSTCVFPLSVLGEVDPETVGQFTGLTDKNGVKIFEGDIIKHYNHIDDPTQFDIGKVFWDRKNVRFLRTFKNGDTYFLCTDMSYPYEVIGNIHDNPELMAGSD